MATLESMAIRADLACDRIENKLTKEFGVKSAPLPRTNRDYHELRAQQLEHIADMLEAIDRDLRLQKAIELVSGGQWTKAQLEALLIGGANGNTNNTPD